MRDLASLLTVTPDDLQKALTHRVIAAGGNVVDKGLTVSEAYYARDAFSKVIFCGIETKGFYLCYWLKKQSLYEKETRSIKMS
mgnify:FL=1